MQHKPQSKRLPKLPQRIDPKEEGKVGLAVLMWMLGVPGVVVLLYLIFG